MKPYKSYQKSLLKDLKDSEEAVGYLKAALRDGSKEIFLRALCNVVEAQGGWSRLSQYKPMKALSHKEVMEPLFEKDKHLKRRIKAGVQRLKKLYG